MGQLAERQRPLRRAEYEHLVAAGVFQNERIELIRGVIIQMSPQNAPHAAVIQRLTRLLVHALFGRADVRVQLPFVVGDDGLPEPDLAVVKAEYNTEDHPDFAYLIVEVADASLKLDRLEKAEVYATAGVSEYWVVNIRDGIVERSSEPVGGAYTRITPYRRGETISPLAFPDVTIRVSELFGG